MQLSSQNTANVLFLPSTETGTQLMRLDMKHTVWNPREVSDGYGVFTMCRYSISSPLTDPKRHVFFPGELTRSERTEVSLKAEDANRLDFKLEAGRHSGAQERILQRKNMHLKEVESTYIDPSL